MLDYFKYVIETGKILQAAFSLPKLFLIGTTNPRRYCHVVAVLSNVNDCGLRKMLLGNVVAKAVSRCY